MLRFEADDKQTLEEIKSKFRTWLEANDISTKDFWFALFPIFFTYVIGKVYYIKYFHKNP